ncbi:2-methylcitrate synthase 1 [Frankliniella fusca]|uniref:2-methylcitrate synthase 1 n=1 Tax=Frankliniella fusca TaxID=407009 RepID=A0AAE1LDE5_9NEOP|nr:2-methylcitrate synthase 1 [Frankliniella fusca]
MAEIDRINHRVRPHPAYVPTEDWLNSACSTYQLMRKTNFRVDPYETRSVATEDPVEPSPYWRLRSRVRKGELPLCAIANFDDETRSIRAQTAALLKRVHSPIPRSRGPLHVVLPTPSSLMETPVPHRHTSDHYIEGLLAPINKVQRDVASRSFYVEHPRPYIGKGNLACVSFAGGKAYGKRRSHYDVPEDHHNVQDDIATLSYYNRARAVANGQEPGPEPAATSSRKARQYRPSTDSVSIPDSDSHE